MNIFQQIAETHRSFVQFDDYAQESLATGCLLNDENEWLRLFKIRNTGWNRGLINDSDYHTLYSLFQSNFHEFNKQTIPVRLTIIDLIVKVEKSLIANGQI